MPLKLWSPMTGHETEERAMQWTQQRDKPAIETWLRRQLHAQYDTALREQVPDEMMRLAEAVAKKP